MLRTFALTLISALLTTALLAQPGQLNRTDEQGRKQGPWSKSWHNGQLRYQGQFENDKPVGEFKHYDEDGNLTTVQQYAKDGTVSRVQHLHPDGALMARGKYLGQQKDSTWNYYDTEGRLRKVEHFEKGELHGEQTTYYPGGQVAERSIFDHGVLHGPSKSWFPTGNLATEETYVNGVAEGRSTLYYPSGKKELEGEVVKGMRHGTWLHFNADGSIHMQMQYKHGDLVKEKRENGTFTEYYGDEQPKAEITYKNGKREGEFVEYHANGTWVIQQVPADPVSGAKADVERVLQGQTRKRTGTYKNDQLHGEVKEYDEKGRTLKVSRYEAGVMVGDEVKR